MGHLGLGVGVLHLITFNLLPSFNAYFDSLSRLSFNLACIFGGRQSLGLHASFVKHLWNRPVVINMFLRDPIFSVQVFVNNVWLANCGREVAAAFIVSVGEKMADGFPLGTASFPTSCHFV